MSNSSEYQKGWDDCLKNLTSAAGEFDEQLAAVKCREFRYASTQYACIDGARWQHAQDAARIAAAELSRTHITLERDGLLRINASLERENAVLRKVLARIKGFHANGITTVAADLAKATIEEADRIRNERGEK